MGFKLKFLSLPLYSLGLYSWYSYYIYVLLPFSLLDFFAGHPTLVHYKEFVLSAFFMVGALLIIVSSVICGAFGDYLFYPFYRKLGFGRWKQLCAIGCLVLTFTVCTRGIFVVRWDYQHPLVTWILNLITSNNSHETLSTSTDENPKKITITAIICFIAFSCLCALGDICYGIMDVSYYSFFNQNCPPDQSGVVGGLIASGETGGFLLGVTIFGTLYPYFGKFYVNLLMGIYLIATFAPFILWYKERTYKKILIKGKKSAPELKVEQGEQKIIKNRNNLVIQTSNFSNLVPTISMNSINSPSLEAQGTENGEEEESVVFPFPKVKTPIITPSSPTHESNSNSKKKQKSAKQQEIPNSEQQENAIYRQDITEDDIIDENNAEEKQENEGELTLLTNDEYKKVPQESLHKRLNPLKKFASKLSVEKLFHAETWKRIIWWKDFTFLFIVCIIQLNVIYAVEEFMAYYLTDIIKPDNFTLPVPHFNFADDPAKNLPMLPFGIEIEWMSFTRNVETAQSICMFVNNFCGVLSSLIAGWVCQKWGPRLVLTASLGTAGVFAVFYSIFPTYFAMTALQTIQGVADGIFFPAHLNYLNNLFFEQGEERDEREHDSKIGVGIAVSSTAFAAPNIILTPISGAVLSLLKPFERVFLFGYEIKGTNYKLLYMSASVLCAIAIVLIFFMTDRKDAERENERKEKEAMRNGTQKIEQLVGKKFKYAPAHDEKDDEFFFLKNEKK